MHPITNYIKERIETLRKEIEELNYHIHHIQSELVPWICDEYEVKWEIISELQAVLSKIEELEIQDKWSFLWFYRWEEMYYGNDVYKKYCAEREKELQELNK